MVPLVLLWGVYMLRLGGFGEWAEGVVFGDFTDIYIVLVGASMLMVAFSRERDEDEYVASLRGKYLMLAFYLDFVFIVITSFAVHEFDYLNIMAVQMYLILFLHIVMFNIAMAVIRKKRSCEE